MAGDKSLQERLGVMANRARHTWEEQVSRKAIFCTLFFLFLSAPTGGLI